MSNPVFILACGPRTGSTWLQRVFTSTGEVLIWGESGILFPWGMLWTPDKPSQKFCFDDRNYEGVHSGRDLHAFRQKGANMWMAVLNPTYSDAFKAHRFYLEKLYGETAKREGYPRWGAKETIWGESTAEFAVNHSGGKVIFLTRKFEASFTSRFTGKAIQNRTHENDVKLWCERWIKQHTYAFKHLGKENVQYIHYEKLCDDEKVLLELLRWAGCKNPPDHTQCDAKISYHSSKDPVSEEDKVLIAPYKEEIDASTKRIEEL